MLGRMNKLFDILPQAEGAQLIRDCWGDVPQFFHIEVFHLKHTSSATGANITIVADFCTLESGELCKPSKIVIQFCDVLHFEYIDAFGHHPAHGINLEAVFTSEPPAGVLAIDIGDRFYVACRRVCVVSCVHAPFTELSLCAIKPSASRKF
jgi:hypothetical protein